MSNSQYVRYAEILVNHSCRVKKGEVVEISGDPITMPLLKEVAKLCYQKGARVRINMYDDELTYLKYRYAHDDVLKNPSKFLLFEAKNTDVFIHLLGETNTAALSNVDSKRIQLAAKANRQAKTIILDKRWVLAAFPCSGLAQEAKMSLEEYEEFVLGACILDWEKMTKECKRVGDFMQKAKTVRIIGEETDLTVNIEGCTISTSLNRKEGEHNMPDGEVFTSPVRYKTEGYIYFPWPSRRAKEVKDVRLLFKKGRVVKASSSVNNDYLQEVIKTDKLSDSLGEVAIGMNPGVKKYTNNILFDEKIGGTIHIAIGAGYKDVGGDPNSGVHWDFVKDLRQKGEVWFDKKLILKNGKILV